MRGVTRGREFAQSAALFQLTRLMRGVTGLASILPDGEKISTHTPHARRDYTQIYDNLTEMTISTHTPHARRDMPFLSIRTVRGHFNSHASCEA